MFAYDVSMSLLGNLRQQYEALGAGPAWVDRSYRALIEVTGRDRVTWTHNLTTNQVKTLTPGEGNYAFVLNLQGRILFDVLVVVRAESVWIDLDSQFLATAIRHFNKYIIMEDVRLVDRTSEFVRAALVGRQAKELMKDWGAAQAAAMAAHSMAMVSPEGVSVEFLRNDFCGEFGVDLFLPAALAPSLATAIRKRAVEVGDEAVQVRRIEGGIPWPGAEVTDEVLAAETRQLERAVSFQKGCYLGQEIVERMRARKVMAKVLSGLKIACDGVPPPGAEVVADGGGVVGQVTSSCPSVALQCPIALAYIKTASATAGGSLLVRWGDNVAPAVVVPLPFVQPGT